MESHLPRLPHRRGSSAASGRSCSCATSPRATRASASWSARSPGSAHAPSRCACGRSRRRGSSARTYAEVPPRVEYALTEKGGALLPIIESMRDYGEMWLGAECATEPAAIRRRVAFSAWPSTTATATGSSTRTRCCAARGCARPRAAGRSWATRPPALPGERAGDRRAPLSNRDRAGSTATVYRALETLHEFGLVRRFDAGEGVARYEPVDPSGDHHHHIVFDDSVRCRSKTTSSSARSTGSGSGSGWTSRATTSSCGRVGVGRSTLSGRAPREPHHSSLGELCLRNGSVAGLVHHLVPRFAREVGRIVRRSSAAALAGEPPSKRPARPGTSSGTRRRCAGYPEEARRRITSATSPARSS